MNYVCRLSSNRAGGFIVQFPDVPEALTEGADRTEALANAVEALELALLGYMKDGDELPPASARPRGGVPIYLPLQTAAKLAFYDAFQKSGLTRATLARRLRKDEAEVRRMLDPYHATKLPALDEALHALGHRFVLDVEPA